MPIEVAFAVGTRNVILSFSNEMLLLFDRDNLANAMRGVNDIFVGAELKRQGVLLRHTLSSPSYFTRTNGHRHAVEIEPLSTCAPSDIIFYRHKTLNHPAAFKRCATFV
jgi:hypothetical protein